MMKYFRIPGIPLLCIALLALLLIPSGVMALAAYSGDRVIVDVPVKDDVFAAGGTVDVNAPVDSLTAAGGTITINAPIKGDVIAAGGTIVVNDRIGGKLIAAGGTVEVNADIGTNAMITAGKVNIHSGSTIGKDAAISAGDVINAGRILGNLSVHSRSFENPGSAGSVDFQLEKDPSGLLWVLGVLGVLFSIGCLILGLVLIRCAPARYRVVEEEVRISPIVKTVVGFVGIIVAVIILVLLSITIIGFPLAITIGLPMILGLLLSVLFVASALGRMVLSWAHYEGKEWQAFIIGFIILSILFRIPVAGAVILLVTVCLGFGALLYAVYRNREAIQGNIP
jgi:hypothetical protein